MTIKRKTWGSPVAKGEFKNTTAMQIAKLSKPTVGRYLKFVATSEIGNNAWTSVSEIGIQATADVTAVDEVRTTPKQEGELYYTLQGVPTSTPTRGIYVHRGKKVLF